MIEDALLDFFEIVVILIEHLVCLDNIDRLGPSSCPKAERPANRDTYASPYNPAAAGDIRDRRFNSRCASFITSSGMPDLSIFARSTHLVLSRLPSSAVAQFLLNGLHLLAQVKLTLRLGELILHLRLNLVAQLQHLALFSPKTAQDLACAL